MHHGLDSTDPNDGIRVRVYDRTLAATEPEILSEADALEGGGAYLLGGTRPLMIADLRTTTPDLGGRRIELRFWLKPMGASAVAFIGWFAGDQDAVWEELALSSNQQMALARLLRSGRVTSDGWIEYTTGPIDYLLGGRLRPSLILQQDNQDLHQQSVVDPEARFAIDGFEVVDLGAAAVPDAACRKPNEATVCGTEGVCYMGRCADHAAVNGPVFTKTEQRRDYVERRKFEMRVYAGHQGLRANLGAFEATVDAAVIGSARRFWPDLRAAWYALGDGHGSPPLAAYTTPPQLGLCLVHGEADLLPGQPRVPLVFSEAFLHPIAGETRVGDAVVAIDGLSPEQWRALLPERLRYNGDPANRAYVEGLQLARVAMLTGAELEFARCPGPKACTEEEVESFFVDTAQWLAPFWDGGVESWHRTGTPCDGRFSRINEGPNVFADTHAATEVRRGATILEINATPAAFQGNVAAWTATVDAALSSGPARLIIDERVGKGGGFDAVDRILAYLRPASSMPGQFLMPWVGDLETLQLFEDMRACAETYPGSAAFLWCGGSRWEPARLGHPNPGGAENSRTAVLTGLDVSGNDFLTLGLARRPGPTRIFGPGPTAGAYGMIMSVPRHDVGLVGGSLQATDGAVLETLADPLDARLSGPGVPPDEVVLQRQSDALEGVDTLMEAAHDWLAQ